MSQSRVQRVGPESASLQALVPWCSSCNGLMGRRGMCAGEVNYFRDYKRLGVIAKLATSYTLDRLVGRVRHQVHQHLYAQITRLLLPADIGRLEALLGA